VSPFDLRGPAFLALYALVSAGGLLLMFYTVRGAIFGPSRGGVAGAHKHLRDPYLVAYLQGGFRHVLATVMFSLHQRKIVLGFGGQQVFVNKNVLEVVHHPLEQVVLRAISATKRFGQVSDDKQLEHAVEAYADPLREAGLIADAEEFRRRQPMLLLVGSVLIVLAVIKFAVALGRGHGNLLFLVLLATASLAALWMIFRRRRTEAGDRALTNQQTLLARLKHRVGRLSADGATNEAVLVAATFGLVALPGNAYPFAADLRKKMNQSNSSGCGGCGSGGGGGGGGCGGCGGCGG
jgi:uncharacterized protein (TIGR04222 family)